MDGPNDFYARMYKMNGLFLPDCIGAVSGRHGIDCARFPAENCEAFIAMIILITGASHTGKTVLAQK